MTRRDALRLTAAGGAAALLPGSATAQQPGMYKGRELVAHSFGASGQDVLQKHVFDWFDQLTGAKSTQAPMLSAQAYARMRAEKDNPQMDLFVFSGGQEAVAKREGLTQPIPNAPLMAEIPAQLKDPDGHWVAWGVVGEGILYRTDKISTPPTSYQDIFKPEYQGHVAFPAIVNGYGMDFLIMLARMNGGGEHNIDPGFKAIKQISERASIFRAPTDVQTLFSQGDIWIMPYDAASAVRNARMGLPIAFAVPKEGSPAVILAACIAAKSKNADMAGHVINRMLSAESQVPIATQVVWGPSNPNVQLPPDVAKTVSPVNQLVFLDRDAINANRPAWTDRWNREIAR